MSKIHDVCSFISILSLVCYPTLVNAQTNLQVQIASGADDLRGGNTAFIELVLVDGREFRQTLSRGLGGGQTATIPVTFSETINENQIRSIRIRHDGNPRSGHPFDHYDNWDLRFLRVNLADRSRSILLYDSARDSSFPTPATRFTGELRQINLPIRPINNEPDFIITRILEVPRGLNVFVRNVGLGLGIVTQVTCSSSGRFITTRGNRRLEVNQETSFTLGFPAAGRVTCTPTGVDTSSNPEVVTANNNFSLVFPGR